MQAITGTIHWLFTDETGVIVLIVLGILICLVISFVMERKTKKLYFNHEKTDDDWDLFGDDDDEDADK